MCLLLAVYALMHKLVCLYVNRTVTCVSYTPLAGCPFSWLGVAHERTCLVAMKGGGTEASCIKCLFLEAKAGVYS